MDQAAADALHARLDDLAEQLQALVQHGASDTSVRALGERLEQVAARVQTLETNVGWLEDRAR